MSGCTNWSPRPSRAACQSEAFNNSGAGSAVAGSLSVAVPAPLFVPLAEEGWTEGAIPEGIADRYLGPLIEAQVDSIILGCTHYPLLRTTIERVLSRSAAPAQVVDSAEALAADLRLVLDEYSLRFSRRDRSGQLRVYVTDQPRSFRDVASRFLGASLGDFPVEAIDLE